METTVEVDTVKKKKKIPAEVPTGVRLSPELRGAVEAICASEDVPIAKFIRDAVEHEVQGNPDRQRNALLRSVLLTVGQFELALEAGVLKDTEAEEQADEIRRFFGQLAVVLGGEKGE